MLPRMNVVLFLGAGFSMEFGHPVMNDFLSFVDATPRLDADEKSLVEKLIIEARQANSFLEGSPTNLEDILSFSVMADRLSLIEEEEGETKVSTSDQIGLRSARSIDIQRILQRVYTTASEPERYWERYDHFWNFVGFEPRNSEHQITIVTTNYDINVESALRRKGFSANPGVAFQQISDKRSNGVNVLYSEAGIPVFKLHGSVNWHEGRLSECEIIVEGRIGRSNPTFDTPTGVELPLVCFAGYRPANAPMIVPPSFLKPDLVRPLRQIWAGAAQALQKCNILVFVGYSFPSSDTDMMYFLARSLVGNPHLRGIHVVDPNAAGIVHRLRERESRFGSHFRSLLHAHAGKWSTRRLHEKTMVPTDA